MASQDAPQEDLQLKSDTEFTLPARESEGIVPGVEQLQPHLSQSIPCSQPQQQDDAGHGVTNTTNGPDSPREQLAPLPEFTSIRHGGLNICRNRVKAVLKNVIWGCLICAYFLYFALALAWNFWRALPLLCVTLLVVFYISLRQVCQTQVVIKIRHNVIKPVQTGISKRLQRKCVQLSCYVGAVSLMLLYCVLVNLHSVENLMSLLGIAVLLLFSWAISYDRANICLRPVVWGFGCQLCLGILVLKTSAGYQAFKWLGYQVENFLNYVIAGVTFVFGERYSDFYFAFKLMPTTIFVSSVMSVLYYVGIMPIIVQGLARVMTVTMGTTAPETMSTAACIFLGQPEASFSIRPYLKTMSNSELHAIMTAGFASVSADIFGLFVAYRISSAHILTAVLMSAPAGLAVSKIVYPQETTAPTPCHHSLPQQPMEDRQSLELTGDVDRPQNIVDAAARGAQEAVPIVLAVGATLIAFLSILEFCNAGLIYLGSLVHIEHLTLELALSYVFMPLSFVMGVPWADCRVVGEVVALKTVLNEFVGYQRLGDYIKDNALSARAQVIATYALCGFSNPTTVGVTLGGLGSLVPERKQDLARLVISAWISGCVTCFFTACFAGLFYHGDMLPEADPIAANVTSTTR